MDSVGFVDLNVRSRLGQVVEQRRMARRQRAIRTRPPSVAVSYSRPAKNR